MDKEFKNVIKEDLKGPGGYLLAFGKWVLASVVLGLGCGFAAGWEPEDRILQGAAEGHRDHRAVAAADQEPFLRSHLHSCQ